MSLEFFIDLILPLALWPWVDSAYNGNEYQEHFLGGKEGRCVRLVSSLSLGDCSVHMLRQDCNPLVTCALNSHQKTVTIPDAALIQFVLLNLSTIVLETCRGM